MVADPRPEDDTSGSYAGWVAGALVIAAVLAVGAIFWFMHHPYPHL